MLLSKIHLPRRTVLKTLGATVGLPLLDAMIPAATALAHTAAAARPCMSFVYFPHGAIMDRWTPATDIAGFALPQILEPLAPFRQRLTVVSGLANQSADASPVHAITPATWLSCAQPRAGSEPFVATTIDQVVAAQLSRDTRLGSIQVATEAQGGEGSTDRSYGSAYARTISFSTPSTPLLMEHDPRQLFRKLVGQDDTPTLQRRSILDLVRHDAADLSRKLGPRDRAVLAEYLAEVRAIERRVQAFTATGSSSEQPASEWTGFDEHLRLMFDLIALAYQANVTRVASFMMAAEVSDQRYDFLGVSDAFHALSHHGNSPAKLQRLAKVQTFNTAQFARFVSKLARIPDGDGSLLDHSLLVYGSNMGNSNLHDHADLPIALVGGACGKLTGNRHVRCPAGTPLANLHLALLRKAGMPARAFGDSTGELDEI